ncbi:MAG TPA: glycosyltransferase [Chitinophagaceae bacterium]|jgi:glycosyltransferase involved in cell wall biosynthesis|nr:glycosyltransferase [Chitinophagaceae bacterium]
MSNKKVIWLYPKLEKWMGGTRYVFECCKLLNKQFDLTVVCQKGDNLVLDKFDEEKIKYVNLQSLSFSDLKFWFFYRFTLSKDRKKLDDIITDDAIIISGMYPMNLLAVGYPNKHLQIIYEPFAFFYDDSFLKSFGFPAYFFFKIVKQFFSRADIKATQKSDAALVLSEFEANQVKRIYKKDSQVIYEGVDISFFYPRNTDAYEAKYKGYFPIMHSTGFDSFKGTDLLVNSLVKLKSIIPNYKLLITYTRENTEKLNNYKEYILHNNLVDNVEFVGLLPYEQLPILYSFAKFYIEVGKNRSMSLSNKEALACGTPVIRGNDSFEEITDGYNGILVNPDSVDDLVEAINIYQTDPGKYNKIKLNCVKSISDRFTWEAVTKKIVNNF